MGNLTDVITLDGDQVHYILDGQNRRVGKELNGTLVQGFLYQNQFAPVAELDGSGNVLQQYVYGSNANVPDYIIQGSNTYRIVTDQVGSVRQLVDVRSGQVMEEIDYDAWGNVTNDTNPGFQPFGFAGGVLDPDTSILRLGARDYDPWSGRWLEKDPILFRGGEASLYAYAGNDPVDFVDPSGLATQVAVGLGGAVIAPGFGISASFSIGINFDGWNSSLYIQDQFNAGIGLGAYAGYGVQAGISNGPAPTTGFDSAKYGEIDAGVGLGGGAGASLDKCGNPSVGANTGIPGVRVGEGVGLGALVGNAYTATAVSPTLGQIFGHH